MNKKFIIMLVILALLLILIPIIVFASKESAKVPKLDDASIAEANKKEKERLLEEKAKFFAEHQNSSGTAVQNTEITYSKEKDEKIEQAAKEVKEKSKKTTNIIKKYYPEQYEEISEKIKIESDNAGLRSMFDTPISENEKRLYDLVLKILENETLTEEETLLLKDYIKGKMYNIEKDDGLKARANEILK